DRPATLGDQTVVIDRGDAGHVYGRGWAAVRDRGQHGRQPHGLGCYKRRDRRLRLAEEMNRILGDAGDSPNIQRAAKIKSKTTISKRYRSCTRMTKTCSTRLPVFFQRMTLRLRRIRRLLRRGTNSSSGLSGIGSAGSRQDALHSVVSLMTRVFDQRVIRVPQRDLHGPWFEPRFRIVERHRPRKIIRSSALEALDHVKLFTIVHEGFGAVVGGIHDQSVAFPTAA